MAAAEAGSFSAAADELYTTQSAVSKQMAKLEKELGETLFDRKNMCSLTAAGQRLLSAAPAALLAVNAACAAATGALSVGALPVADVYGFTGIMTSFGRSNPDIKYSVREYENLPLLRAVSLGEPEVAFVRFETGADRGKLETAEITCDKLALAVPSSHPLARKSRISLAESSSQNFIFLKRETGLYDAALRCCRTAGFEPNVVYCGSSAQSIARFVLDGAGVAIFQKKVALSLAQSDLSIIDFDETVHSTLVAAWRPDFCLSRGAKKLIRHITEQ